jgi:hypothetical protein
MRVLWLIITFNCKKICIHGADPLLFMFKRYYFVAGDDSMKQKYTILKNKTTGNLMIQEYAELDKDLFSLVCEETYDIKEVEFAVSAGKVKLIANLRTPNLYPIAEYADKIADAVMALFESKTASDEPVELVFDDIKVMRKNESVPAEIDKPAKAIIDDLLEEEEFVDVPEAEAIEEESDLDIMDEEKDD